MSKPKEITSLADLQLDPANVNKGTERGKEMINWSVSDLGAGRSILVGADGAIIAGNKTFEAAKALGLDIEVVQSDGRKLIVVQRTDAALLGDQKSRDLARKLALADNRTSEIDYNPDLEQLLAHLQSGIEVPVLYSPAEMDALLAEYGGDPDAPGGGGDDFDVEPKADQTRVRLGDLWELGNHRVLCGDSTKPADMARLMGEDKAWLLLTDPPYNVAYEGKTSEALTIENDSMSDENFRKFLVDAFQVAFNVMQDGASFYIWHADSEGYNFRGAIHDIEEQVRQCLIWIKNSMVMGRQDFHWKHEPCLYGWKAGAAHRWFSDRTQTTCLEFDRPTSSQDHPTMKPLSLWEYQLNCSSQPGEIVLDSFGGSGTTVIACERLRRKARVMELDPKYAHVIVERWEAESGRTARLLDRV